MKKLLPLIMLALVVFSLSAKNIQWNFSSFPESCLITYTIDEEDEWKKLPSNNIVVENLNGRNEHILSYKTSLSGDKIFHLKWEPVLKNELSFSLSPYSLSLFTYKGENILSNYSFSFGTTYQYRLDGGFGYGFESLFTLSNLAKDKGIYSDTKFGLVGSYKHFVNDKQFINFSLALGADAVFYASSPEVFFYAAVAGEYGWILNNKLSVTTALRNDISFISGGSIRFEFTPKVNLVCHF